LAVRGEASALPAAAGFDAAALPEAAVLPPQPASRPASRVSASARAKIRFFHVVLLFIRRGNFWFPVLMVTGFISDGNPAGPDLRNS
jgi:hypothetical protein